MTTIYNATGTISNSTMFSTGNNGAGVPIQFAAEVPPYRRVNVMFLSAYSRTAPTGAFVLQDTGMVAPNAVHSAINQTVTYSVGDVVALGENEAAALVGAGIVAYH